MPEGQTGAPCENLWKKMIGKPYSGKLNVRFDEGELEIEPSATTPALYSTVSIKLDFWIGRILEKRGVLHESVIFKYRPSLQPFK